MDPNGQIAQSAYFVPASQDVDCIFCPGEWGPTPADERHRVVVFSVVEQIDILGHLTDRYVNPATGRQVSVNSQRGDRFVLLDARVTKFFTVWQENRKLGVFVEFFNLFNTYN